MLVAALVVAAAVSASAAPASAGTGVPADGTYTYTITRSGDAIGKSSLTIKRDSVGLVLHETETEGPYSFDINEILDTQTLAPKAYTGTYKRGDVQTIARAAFDRNGATITLDGVPGTAQLPNPPGVNNAYVLEFQLMSGFAMLPAQIHASKAAQFSQIMPRQVKQDVGRVDPHPAAARPAGVPANDIELSVIVGQASFDEWYDPATLVLHALSVPTQQLLITLTK